MITLTNTTTTPVVAAPQPPPTPEPDLPTRQVNLARQQAQYLKNKIMQAFSQGELQNWGEIESVYGLALSALLPPSMVVTDAFRKAKPLSFNLDQLLSKYVNDTPQRLKAALVSAQDDLPKLKLKSTPEADCYVFRNAPPDSKIKKLMPAQDAVFNLIYNSLFNNLSLEPNQPAPRALLQNGKTGSGKTVVADAIIDKFIAEGRHLPTPSFPIQLPFPVIWFTVANAKEQTRRSLEAVGLGPLLDKYIHVLAYSDLSTQLGLARFVDRIEEPDLFDPAIVKTIWRFKKGSLPKLCLLDEAHSVQNEDSIRSEIIKAMDEAERECVVPQPDGTTRSLFDTKFVYLTATPVERVTDLKLFVCMTNLVFQGTRITYENYNTLFANVIANGEPQKVTRAATKRLWEVLRHRVIELPRTKWKHKAINSIRFYRFETPEEREFYAQAWERHVERCKLLGKDADAGAEYTSLMIFAKEVEPIRARQIVREMVENVRKGGTSVMATRFTGSIIKSAFHLQDDYGLDRDDFSIIWGGRKNIEPTRILTANDLTDIFKQAEQNGTLDAETKRLIKRNLEWQEDRLLFGDVTDSAQAARYQRLKDMGLIGIQTKERRQREIDKFMSGRSRYCLFTADSGGTGLSLEHASELTAQRTLWATPIYSGKQFTQMFGRCPRINSWSDSIQYCCLMDGTVESEHVAPILDNKLQSGGEFSSSKDDIAMALAQKKVRSQDFRLANQLDTMIRTVEQAAADAENPDSQIVGSSAEDDDGSDD